MRLIDQRSGLEIIDRDDCLRLLATRLYSVGRVAVLDGRHPVILPVNYGLDGDHIVFRTAAGTKLDAALHGGLVAFEIDHVDDKTESGWSVLVKGRAELVTTMHDLMRLRALPLTPWAEGEHANWIRIAPEHITGRRVASVGHFSTEWPAVVAAITIADHRRGP